MSFPLINPSHQFFDTSGSPLVSGTVEFRDPTTNSLIDTYPTADDANAQTNANINPFTLDSRGGFTGIYLEDGVAYKVIIKDSAGSTVDTQDDVLCPVGTQASISLVTNPRTAAEISAGVTPVDYSYEAGDILRYGTNTTPGTTDMSTAMQNCVDSNDFMDLGDETLLVTKQISIAKTFNLKFGNCTIDASSATTSGNFADNAVLYFDGGALVALPDLSVSPSEGDQGLTFATDPSLSANDVFIIFNPTTFSFSGHRSEYNAGEFCKVLSAVTTAVTLYSGLYAGYTFGDVDVYKLPGRKFTFSGGSLNIISPDTLNGVAGVELVRAVGGDISNVSAENSGHAGIILKQCYGVNGDNVCPTQSETGTAGTDYGLLIANSQTSLINGNFWGKRHAATLGGDAEIGNVPCRDVHVSGTFTNDANQTNVNAANHHGNVEFCSFNGVYNGGVNPAGDNNRYKGIVRKQNTGMAVAFSELLGWSHDLSGLVIDAIGDPQPSNRGTIDLGGNSSVATSSTTRGGYLDLRNITVRAPDSNRILEVRNRGSAPSDEIIVDISGLKAWKTAAAISTGLRVDSISGNSIDVLFSNDIYVENDPATAFTTADITNRYGYVELNASATWDPANAVSGGPPQATNITVTGAALGDMVLVSFSLDVQDLTLTGNVVAANTVAVVLTNTTAGDVNLASGTLRVRVLRVQ